MKVDVAVIPAAGRGTRMRPATRVVPKAMLAVINRPAVQYAVEEAARAGVTEAIVVVDPEVGEMVDRHFFEEGRLEGLEHVRVTTVIQKEPRGLGDAVRVATDAVGDRAFFCLLVDNIVVPGHDVLPLLAEASDGRSVVCLRELTDEYLSRYGVIVPGTWSNGRVVEAMGAVEKPGVDAAPSRLGLIGRYLFTPEIFPLLASQEPGYGGEIQLTDAIDALGRAGRCLGAVAGQDLLDVGNPLGLLAATVILGMHDPECGEEFREFLGEVVEPT